ncbi:MAG: RidA family protein [Legionellales bacterium]|nr:RidA family protein [Legionellales bacterium]
MKKFAITILLSLLVTSLSFAQPALKEAIYTKNSPAPIGTYSQAINVGNTVYISGQIPLDPKTGKLVAGDFSQQAKQALANLNAITQAAGGDLNNIVKITVYLTDLKNFSTFNQLMAQYFHPPYPARAVVEVKRLADDSPIEIEAIMIAKNHA